MNSETIAAIRLRGSIKMSKKIIDTLKMLNLDKVNTLSIIENTPSNVGMVKKVGSFITWGEASEDTKKMMSGKKFIRLMPKKGGLKSLKKKYPTGSLGYRGDKINELAKEMIQNRNV